MTVRIRTKLPPTGEPQPVIGNIEITDQDGNELPLVTGLTIQTKIGDVVRANIELFIDELEIHAEEEITYIDKDGNKYKMIEEVKPNDER